MRITLLSALASTALALSGCSMEGGETASASSAAIVQDAPDFARAVSAPGRDAKDVELDASRKPAEILSFMGLEVGDNVADMLAGGGYYSEIMGRAVGPNGSVTAYNTGSFAKTENAIKKWSEVTARQSNVEEKFISFPDFAPDPDSFDFAMMHLVYHDAYWESEKFNYPRIDPDKFLAALFSGMKPGGIVAVVDHIGGAGDTREIVEKLHRIDPAVVKSDFAKAGFVLEAESDMFANPDDDVNKLVFDPAIRGKTSRMVMKFRKPG